MADKIPPFKFNARAHGLSGHITLPFNREIKPQALVELPENGGHKNSRIDAFELEHVVSFDSAYSSVVGSYSEDDDAFFTVTTSTVEGLDIMGVITADRIVARVMCRHPKTKQEDQPEPAILPTGCHIDNLVIAGHPVKVKLHVGTLCHLDTFSKLRDHGPHRLGDAYHRHDSGSSTVHCTLVDSIDTGGAPELHAKGRDSISIEQFGTVRFGELTAKSHRRTVTMMRVNLGCATKGVLLLDSVDGNGTGGGT
jgi:hypothetical protein